MRFVALSLLSAALLASCGGGADETTGDSAAAPAGSWRVLPDESTLGFEATQTGESFEGTFRDFNAVIVFNPDELTVWMAVVPCQGDWHRGETASQINHCNGRILWDQPTDQVQRLVIAEI